MIVAGKKRNTTDTFVRLIRSIDTITTVKDSNSLPAKVYGREWFSQVLFCRDTLLSLRLPLTADSTTGNDSLNYTLADTSYLREYKGRDDCHKKWEIAADGGASFNGTAWMAVQCVFVSGLWNSGR